MYSLLWIYALFLLTPQGWDYICDRFDFAMKTSTACYPDSWHNFYQFLAITSAGSPSGKSSRSSVFSLFNLKEKSRFWSEAVIRGGMTACFPSLNVPSIHICGGTDCFISFNVIIVVNVRFWWFGIFQTRKNGCSQLHKCR